MARPMFPGAWRPKPPPDLEPFGGELSTAIHLTAPHAAEPVPTGCLLRGRHMPHQLLHQQQAAALHANLDIVESLRDGGDGAAWADVGCPSKLGLSTPASAPLPSRLRVPRSFVCPITRALMREPVSPLLLQPLQGPAGATGAATPGLFGLPVGVSFERAALTGWLAARSAAAGPTSASLHPLQPQQPQLVPNVSLRLAIEEWLLQHGLDHCAADQLLLLEWEVERESREGDMRREGREQPWAGGGGSRPGPHPGGSSSGTRNHHNHQLPPTAAASSSSAPLPLLPSAQQHPYFQMQQQQQLGAAAAAAAAAVAPGHVRGAPGGTPPVASAGPPPPSSHATADFSPVTGSSSSTSRRSLSGAASRAAGECLGGPYSALLGAIHVQGGAGMRAADGSPAGRMAGANSAGANGAVAAAAAAAAKASEVRSGPGPAAAAVEAAAAAAAAGAVRGTSPIYGRRLMFPSQDPRPTTTVTATTPGVYPATVAAAAAAVNANVTPPVALAPGVGTAAAGTMAPPGGGSAAFWGAPMGGPPSMAGQAALALPPALPPALPYNGAWPWSWQGAPPHGLDPACDGGGGGGGGVAPGVPPAASVDAPQQHTQSPQPRSPLQGAAAPPADPDGCVGRLQGGPSWRPVVMPLSALPLGVPMRLGHAVASAAEAGLPWSGCSPPSRSPAWSPVGSPGHSSARHRRQQRQQRQQPEAHSQALAAAEEAPLRSGRSDGALGGGEAGEASLQPTTAAEPAPGWPGSGVLRAWLGRLPSRLYGMRSRGGGAPLGLAVRDGETGGGGMARMRTVASAASLQQLEAKTKAAFHQLVFGGAEKDQSEERRPGAQEAGGKEDAEERVGEDDLRRSWRRHVAQPTAGPLALPVALPLPLQWLSAGQLAGSGLSPRDERQAAERQAQRMWSWLEAAPAPACRDLFTLQRCMPASAQPVGPLRCSPVGSGAHHRITALAVLPPPPPPPPPYNYTQYDSHAGVSGASKLPPPHAHMPLTRGSFAVLLTKDRPGHAVVEELQGGLLCADGGSGSGGRCWTVPAVRGRVTAVAACPRGSSLAVGTTSGLVFVWRCFDLEELEALAEVEAGVGVGGGGAEGGQVGGGGGRSAAAAATAASGGWPVKAAAAAPAAGSALEWHLCGRLGWREEVLWPEDLTGESQGLAGRQAERALNEPASRRHQQNLLLQQQHCQQMRQRQGAGSGAADAGGGGGGAAPGGVDRSVTALAYDGSGSTLFASCCGVVAGWKLRRLEQPESLPTVHTSACLLLTPDDYGYRGGTGVGAGAGGSLREGPLRFSAGGSHSPNDHNHHHRNDNDNNTNALGTVIANRSGTAAGSPERGGGGGGGGGSGSGGGSGGGGGGGARMVDIPGGPADTADAELDALSTSPFLFPPASHAPNAPAAASFPSLSPVPSAPPPYPTVCCLAASPSGSHLALALSDGTVHLVLHADSPDHTACVRLLPPGPQPGLAAAGHPHPGAAAQLAFSSDERRLLVLALGLRQQGEAGGAAGGGGGQVQGHGGGGGGGSGRPGSRRSLNGGTGAQQHQQRSGGHHTAAAAAAADVRYGLHCFPLVEEIEEEEEEEEGEEEEDSGDEHYAFGGSGGGGGGGDKDCADGRAGGGGDGGRDGPEDDEGDEGARSSSRGGPRSPLGGHSQPAPRRRGRGCCGDVLLDQLPVPPQSSRGAMLTGLAVSPDGTSALLLDTATPQLLFVDLQEGAARPVPLALQQQQYPIPAGGAGSSGAGGAGRNASLRSCSCLAVLPGGREMLVGGDSGLLRWRFEN